MAAAKIGQAPPSGWSTPWQAARARISSPLRPLTGSGPPPVFIRAREPWIIADDTSWQGIPAPATEIDPIEVTPMRNARLRARLTIIAAVGAVAAGTWTLPASAASFACFPENPVCVGIAGTPGNYRLTFTIRSPAPQLSLNFTLNGEQAYGSVTIQGGPASAYGNFQPYTPLVAGDKVCMTLWPSPTPGPYCDTVPA
ncbi:hypothetical protein ACQEU3_43430 [Spirillospora sp. CA-253888]